MACCCRSGLGAGRDRAATSQPSRCHDAATGTERLRRLRIALLVLPSLAVVRLPVGHLPHVGDTLDIRPWTIGQRLLTEPRVLLDYLHLLVVPRVLSTGFTTMPTSTSTGWMQPPPRCRRCGRCSAWSSPLLRCASARRRWRQRCCSTLPGHLLESTRIPLELYFEHRNYLPATVAGLAAGARLVPLARAGRGHAA